jgi:hypothetical protein
VYRSLRDAEPYALYVAAAAGRRRRHLQDFVEIAARALAAP